MRRRRLCLFVLLWIITGRFFSQAAAQELERCQPAGGDVQTLQFLTTADDPEELSGQIVDFLNTNGAPEELQGALEAVTLFSPDSNTHIDAQVIHGADFTGDNADDVVALVTASYAGERYNGGYALALSLLSCDSTGYFLRGTATQRGTIDTAPVIAYAVDLNGNGVRDLLLNQSIINGQKSATLLNVYEWDGTALTSIWEQNSGYGRYSYLRLFDGDANPLTMELAVGFRYSYEQETAAATIEYTFTRPIEMRFAWQPDSDTYVLSCQHFTDQPNQRLTILHSAETYRSCGMIQEAVAAYARLVNDWDIAGWEQYPWIAYSEDLSYNEQLDYANQLESAYYRAFAMFRLIQVNLTYTEPPAAVPYLEISSPETYLSMLSQAYQPGDPGYEYVVMAEAYLGAFTEASNKEAACAAALLAQQQAIASGDEPRIPYQTDDQGDTRDRFGFYFANGHRYGANPDDLFNVPEDIDSMISTPLCL